MRPLLQLAHHLRRAVFRLLRVQTIGVKVMLFDGDGRLLLVRNSYGKTQQHLLPGGGVKRREAPMAAAAREVREEVGVEAVGDVGEREPGLGVGPGDLPAAALG